ncbi:CDP-glycerol glycerophosphotransferase family protein [Streptomyces sp. M10(2022)]
MLEAAPRPTICCSHPAGTRPPSGSGTGSPSRTAIAWCCTRRRTATSWRTGRADHGAHSTGTRYRWDPALDLPALAGSLAGGHTVLVRRHPRVTGGLPVTGGPALRDVSGHPDTAELLLIADVLITDYAGLMFDFAHTGRPMLFHTYDLEHYRDTVRGFCLDFETRAPGPLLVTTEEVAQALRTTEAVAHRHADAYDSFRRDHCDLDDGGAAGRVADRLLRDGG